jgi:uncharacterized protein (UPF0332 family)
MSQASNHVKWCLAKAQKEIEECEKLGKRPKHRGLAQIKPDVEKAKKHLEKAEHNLQATEYLKKGKFADLSAGTLFYSIYHCFLAIAVKFGYESKNQACTVALTEWLIEEGKISLDKKFVDLLKSEDSEKNQIGFAINIREEYTYGADISLKDEKKVDELIKTSKELIDKTKDIIF